MKIEMSIHTFLVAISKLGQTWGEIDLPGSSADLCFSDIADLFDTMESIEMVRSVLPKIPKIDSVDFSKFNRYAHPPNIPDIDWYMGRFTYGVAPDIMRDLLDQFLELPDGVVCLEVTPTECHLWQRLIEAYYYDSSMFLEYRDDCYKKIVIIEE